MASLTRIVTDADTAIAVGSGDLEVLGTPVVVAWCEAATCAELELEAHLTSVGTHVDVRHLAPSPVGATIEVTATVTERSDRAATFAVEARQGETVVAAGTVVRAVVDRARFLSRL
ncbi:thioesterase family protein [Aeromicrobium sp. Leaf350]|uniref:thioesterase family protein n=1 Tax=Aeromicrobium sp. Leaf350 TaxID=2876565 RepID=UPI001E556661|nr:hotdog domain-containing protein [Aeromicrobium sp. Leaf350]